MPISRPMLLASRQAAFMTDNDSYSPNSFVADGRDMGEAGSGDKSRLPQLVETSRRAAEELTADAIADPRGALSDEAAQRAAFEARLEARWGRSLDRRHRQSVALRLYAGHSYMVLTIPAP